MAAEKHDIVAQFSRSAQTTSTGALAAYLARACGHVLVDARVIRQGYRFYPEVGEEIPAFFNKRISTGSSSLSITLMHGIDPSATPPSFGDKEQRWSIDPFDGCKNTRDAEAVINKQEYHASLWQATITVGVETFSIDAVAEPLFIAKHPNEFRVIAEELVTLGALQGDTCLICSLD